MSVWRRLQRVGKKAAKFQFVSSLQQVNIKGVNNWQPDRIVVLWTRRQRQFVSKPRHTEASSDDADSLAIVWDVPENIEFAVTLFRNKDEFEDKEWLVAVDNVDKLGRRKRLAASEINMRNYVSLDPVQHEISLNLKSCSKKVSELSVKFTLSCRFLREGKATDDDMQSIASMISIPQAMDIANMDDLDDDSLMDSSTHGQICEIAAKCSLLTAMDEAEEDQQNDEAETSQTSSAANSVFYSPQKGKNGDLEQDQKVPLSTESMSNLVRFERTQASASDASDVPDDDKTHVASSREHLKLPLQESVGAEAGNAVSNGQRRHVSAPVGAVAAAAAGAVKRRSPTSSSLDLLAWCQHVTQGYRGIKLTNMTTSWRNGMAFLAIIHHFRPDLVDYDTLVPADIKGNNQKAFEICRIHFGIPSVIDPEHMAFFKVPDKLSVMTYLHQMRSYFTGEEMEVQHLTQRNSVYRLKVDDEMDAPIIAEVYGNSADRATSPTSPGGLPCARVGAGVGATTEASSSSNSIPTTPSSLSSRSPSKEKDPPGLGALRQASLDVPEPQPGRAISASSTFCVDTSNRANHSQTARPAESARGQSVSVDTIPLEVDRQQKIRARAANSSAVVEEERQRHLKARARKLIEQAREGLAKPQFMVTPSSPLSPATDIPKTARTSTSFYTFSPARQSVDTSKSKKAPNNDQTVPTRERSLSPISLTSESSSDADEVLSMASEYVKQEMWSLQAEQERIDKEAVELEKELRKAMASDNINSDTEEILMQDWFSLVNRKNALIRRQAQLSILAKEQDLERRTVLLNKELQTMMDREDWKKSPEEKEREKRLLDELLNLVNMRDELVVQLDTHERGIQEDEQVEDRVRKAQIPAKATVSEKCCVQ